VRTAERDDMTYDRIGTSYTTTRRSDARIMQAIREALGDARTVVNVGAGAGSYEPADLEVLAVEPSAVMIAQRAPGSAPVVQGSAERLPLADASFDAALAVNTLQHWSDVRAGLCELRRVARRVVIFLRHPASGVPFWLTRDYLPALERTRRSDATLAAIHEVLPGARSTPFPLPRDLADGLFTAFWGRPEAYLDAEVRRNISNFAQADAWLVAQGLGRLREDLASGAWDAAHGALRTQATLDLGHRVIVAG